MNRHILFFYNPRNLVFYVILRSFFIGTDRIRFTDAYIENKGSDTIVNLALAWAEKYQATTRMSAYR
jgi:hypothetical protein